MQFLETRSEVKFNVTMTQWYATLRHRRMHRHIIFEIPTSNNMRYAPDEIILKTRSGQGQCQSDLKMVRDSPPSQDASTHRNSHLKEYKKYAPDTIILKTRSEIKVKVTGTRKWYVTLRHSRCIYAPDL